MPTSARELVSRLLLALSAGAAIVAPTFVLSAGSDASVEDRFLAIIVIGVLGSLALLAREPAIEALSAALLATAAAWVIPAGPLRGATVWIVLTAALVLAISRRLQAKSRFEASAFFGLALAVQFLARPGLLLPFALDLHRLAALFVLPAVAAIALTVLARRYSPITLLLVATPLLVVAPGFNTAATLALVALALGESGRSHLPPSLSWLPPAALCLLALAWEPATIFFLALIGVAATAPRNWWRQSIVSLLAVGLVVLEPGIRPTHALFVLLPIVLGLAPLALASMTPAARYLSAVTLLITGILVVPEPAAVTAALALATLAEHGTTVTVRLAAIWATILAAGSLLAAGYPWVRPLPLSTILSVFHINQSWLATGFFLAICILLFLLGGRSRLRHRLSTLLTATALVLLAMMGLPHHWPLAETSPRLAGPHVLSARNPSWAATWKGARLRRMIVDTSAANVTSLSAGTVLARISLITAGGRHLDHLVQLARDSDDWALWRPDLRYRLDRVKARPWIHWVSGEQFFASRYRMIWTLPATRREALRRILVVRSPRLPLDVTLSLSFLGAER